MENDKLSSLSKKQLEQIIAKRKRYVVKMDKKDNRTLDLNPTVNNMYEVLATLIKDLQEAKILDKK